jgi:uncharacterized FlgJ-related protein
MIVMFLTIFLLILFLVILVPSLLLTVVARIIAFFKFGSKKHVEREEGEVHGAHGYRPADKKNERKKIFDKNEGEYVDFEEIK